MNGELVRSLADHNPMEKGLVALIWDGKTLDNTYARNGRYLVHIKVKDSSGEQEELKSTVLIK
jgi:flagellar hook assembly protein FlgD